MAASDNPFSASSIWNKELPATTTYSNAAGVANLIVGLSTWIDSAEYSNSIPVYYATEEDQVVSVLYNSQTWSRLYAGDWENVGNSKAIERAIIASSGETFPFTYHTYVSQSGSSLVLPSSYNKISNPDGGTARLFHMPANAIPALNADGHLVVVQPDGTVVEMFGAIVLSNGTVVAQSYQVTNLKSAGDGWQNGTTASMLPAYAGLITQADIDSGVIDHAIKLTVPASLLAPFVNFPAASFDRDALTSSNPYSGTLPMGSVLALPAGFNLASLGLTSKLGKMIADAALKHGFIITDRGGSGITVGVEAGVTNSAAVDWNLAVDRDLHKIFDALKTANINPANYDTGPLSNLQAADARDPGTNDVFVGDGGADRYDGGLGNDHLDGRGGNDTLIGGHGNDILTGGAGDDVLQGGNGNDILRGDGGADYLEGGAGNDTYMLGGDTSDTIVDSAGIDTIMSGITRNLCDYLAIERLFLTGTANINAVGNALSNNLRGNAGNNILSGGNGNDSLEGGLGRDKMAGGSGNDYFVFRTANDSPSGAGRDVVTDFKDQGADKIDLRGVYSGTLSYRGDTDATGAHQVTIKQVGSGVLVSVELDGNLGRPEMEIHLLNIRVSQLSGADFLL